MIKNSSMTGLAQGGMLKRVVKEDIRSMYKFEKELGSGAFGSVRVCSRIGQEDKKYAVKTIKREIIKEDPASVEAELETMNRLDSPYIVKFHEVFYDDTYLHIVMEHIDGGDLSNRMKKKPDGRFGE